MSNIWKKVKECSLAELEKVGFGTWSLESADLGRLNNELSDSQKDSNCTIHPVENAASQGTDKLPVTRSPACEQTGCMLWSCVHSPSLLAALTPGLVAASGKCFRTCLLCIIMSVWRLSSHILDERPHFQRLLLQVGQTLSPLPESWAQEEIQVI